ncbi:MAG TPA: DNA polymerase Y family protein [Candidatus Deferrimicrobiaceae bacterium]|jgi:protein ImuB|nr:DNA polymerase Y family protein [Candidatus Deferrimicrobiaceae bacterium]
MPFACIFVPNFPVAALLRAEPEQRALALAIFAGKPPLERVFAVNEGAKRVGIMAGMTKAQAELCYELTLRPRSSLQESVAHAALLNCAQSFSPCVEDAAADTVILDLAGMESLFGSLPEIARNLFRRAAELGIDGNVAVASNPDVAAIAARGFSGVTVIPAGRESESLGSLSVEALFAGGYEGKKDDDQKSESGSQEMLFQTLDRWGVRNLRELAALPAIALSERLGQEGLRLQQLARGAASRTLVPVEMPPIFEEAIELEYPIVLLEPLAFLLNRLLENICARLASRALHTQQLRLTLELETFSFFNQPPVISNQQSSRQSEIETRNSKTYPIQFHRTLSLPLPMLDPKLFLKLLQLDLNAHPPGAPILKIHLAAEPARPRSAQAGLFLPPTPEPEKLELTLARIAGLVGESSVGSLELLDAHRAESFRMRRFAPGLTQEISAQEKLSLKTAAEDKSAIAALRMFRPPLRAIVTMENGELARVVCPKKKELQGIVLWKAGPWRSSGDWWEREAWARDEWDIALQNADGVALYRLMHDLLGGGWFVEGTYD